MAFSDSGLESAGIIPRGASGLDRVQFCFRKSGKNLAVFIPFGAWARARNSKKTHCKYHIFIKNWREAAVKITIYICIWTFAASLGPRTQLLYVALYQFLFGFLWSMYWIENRSHDNTIYKVHVRTHQYLGFETSRTVHELIREIWLCSKPSECLLLFHTMM